MRANYKVGDTFKLRQDAQDNYQVGPDTHTVRAVYTHYCKPDQMQSDPTGHPGFDANGGSPLYGSELPFDVYEWEMVRA
jgi:hypothetical protein